MKLFATFIIAGSLAASCSRGGSNDVRTNEITAEVTAVADGSAMTTVYATLYIGDPTNLDVVLVDSPDALIADFGSDRDPMVPIALGSVGGTIEYTAAFPDATSGDQFTVDYSRGDGDVSAPNSVATLPAGFTLDAPPTMASRAQALTVTWTSAADPNPMQWNVIGSACIDAAAGSIMAGALSVTIPANTLIQAGSAVTSCQVTVIIQRNETGMLDPAFGSGRVVGVQARAFQLISNP